MALSSWWVRNKLKQVLFNCGAFSSMDSLDPRKSDSVGLGWLYPEAKPGFGSHQDEKQEGKQLGVTWHCIKSMGSGVPWSKFKSHLGNHHWKPHFLHSFLVCFPRPQKLKN